METKTIRETSFNESFQVYKPRIFTYRELAKATSGFSKTNILGEGVFGVVYKGRLPSKVIVAIKKLKDLPNEQQKEEFEKKIKNVSTVKSYMECYADLENNKKASEGSDIYAFGIVPLELITGRKINERGNNIINWIVGALEGHIPLKDIWEENDKEFLYNEG
ncbi:L-type lectin-domain containing receptor kinase VI.2-like [Hevea brasiliensis]|uniref:L-type lectin-domain containing receptor kinase VI.2-like n=1 Tax=Hevea brasiliensis TaxID=3981 RepID=UPI0025F7F9F0|nr:L-type lectin-domain containing receptor kinase VI.2-like [Hevea brasiliensis]